MNKKRFFLGLLSLVLVAAVSVGATLAYLSAEDTKVTNTFSFGEIDVEIEEDVPTQLPDGAKADKPESGKGVVYSYLTPGMTLPKVPKVSVDAGVKSYVFIEISGFKDKVMTATDKTGTSTIDSSWTLYTGTGDGTGNGVYYQIVEANSEMTFLANAFTEVTISNALTGEETLDPVVIDVFAVQYANIELKDAYDLACASFAAAE